MHLGAAPAPETLAGETRSENGKPYFPAYPDFHYNISHSGGLVVCGFADHPLGIDIQAVPSDPGRALKILFSSRQKKKGSSGASVPF